MPLPKKSNQKNIGERASSKVRDFILSKNWIFRSQEDQNDFGVDGEIEVVLSSNVLGVIAKVQIKGAESLDWTTNINETYVKKSTYEYWRQFNIPVIGFLVDLQRSEIYWTLPVHQQPRQTKESVVIEFTKDREVKKTSPELAAFILSWQVHFSYESAIENIPHYHGIFLNLMSETDHGDKTSSIDDELNTRFREFYRHVQQIRLVSGFSLPVLIPLKDWYTRNYAFVNDDVALSHAVLSEAILYSKDFYIEALTRIKQQLADQRVDSKFGVVADYLEGTDDFTDSKRQSPSISIIDPRYNELEFHDRIEEILKEVGALRFSFRKKEVY